VTAGEPSAPRGRLDGAVEILRYNWHFYVAGAALVIVAAVTLRAGFLPPPLEALLAVAAALTAFWFVASLASSYYVYDLNAVTSWRWLPAQLPHAPARWLNIHAGLDQSTTALRRFFPNSADTVCDIYDPLAMTEPSIARARRTATAAPPAVTSQLDALPFETGSCDAVFLLFAAHEIREAARRDAFFREVARVLGAGGYVFLVEHLRDGVNFAAFGPGFLHFFSRAEWLRAAAASGLTLGGEGAATPFVRWFIFRKPRP
jgi:SAM-dependent methyltransferase